MKSGLNIRGEIKIFQGETLIVNHNQVTIEGAKALLSNIVASEYSSGNMLTSVAFLNDFEDLTKSVTLSYKEIKPLIQKDSIATLVSEARGNQSDIPGENAYILEVEAKLPPFEGRETLKPYTGVALMIGLLPDSSNADDVARIFAYSAVTPNIIRSNSLNLRISWRIHIDVVK